MSNSELGMLVMVVVCLVFTVITVVTAGRRIEEEKKRYKSTHQHNNMLTDWLKVQKRLNLEMEKQLAETIIKYEKLRTELDEATATATYYEKSTLDAEENSLHVVSITEIATELCKLSDVVHFLIDVKNDTQKYSLSGGR